MRLSTLTHATAALVAFLVLSLFAAADSSGHYENSQTSVDVEVDAPNPSSGELEVTFTDAAGNTDTVVATPDISGDGRDVWESDVATVGDDSFRFKDGELQWLGLNGWVKIIRRPRPDGYFSPDDTGSLPRSHYWF